MWSDFHLLRPWWLLALLPLLLAAWRIRRGGSRRNPWSGVVDDHLLDHLRHPLINLASMVPLRLLLLCWLVTVVALAGPTWSRVPPLIFRPTVPPLVIVLDLSRSMDATDLKPSRLTVARLKLQALLDQLPPRPVGLVVYAGSAHMVLPLTEDRRIVSATLDALESGLMPSQGRVATAGLLLGYELTRQTGETEGEILLVGDGVEAAAIDTARRLSGSGLTVSVLAIGTSRGDVIPAADAPVDEGGSPHKGEGVQPRLEGDALQRLANAGGGRFALAGHDDRDIEWILAGLERPVAEDGAGMQGEGEIWRDRGAELVLLLLPLAVLAFRRGWLGMVVLAVGLHAPNARAFEWLDLWLTPDQQGVRVLERGDFERAALLFHDPLWRGVALYRNGDYEQAVAEFGVVDLPLAHYNRGNALVRLGRAGEALAAYGRAIELDPDHADARFNRDQLVGALLRRERRMEEPHEPAPKVSDEKGWQAETQKAQPYVEEKLEVSDRDQLGRMEAEVSERQHEVESSLGGGAMLLRGEEGVEGRVGTSRGRETEGGAGRDEAEASMGAAGRIPSGMEQTEGALSGKLAPKTVAGGEAPPAQEQAGDAAPSMADVSGEIDNNDSIPYLPAGGGEEAGRSVTTGIPGELLVESESDQAREQWLNRIPDDPGGYLKEKFAREYRRQRRHMGGVERW